jgi:hypothetical protein
MLQYVYKQVRNLQQTTTRKNKQMMFNQKNANKLGWKTYQYEQAISLLALLGFVSIVTGASPMIVAPLLSAGLFGLAFCMGDSFSLSLLMTLSIVVTGLFMSYAPVLLGSITFDVLFLTFVTLPWVWKKSRKGEALLDIKEFTK